MVNNEFEGVWTESDYCLFEEISQHFPEESEEKHEKISQNNGAATEIGTRSLSNTSLKHYCFSQFSGPHSTDISVFVSSI
jgi:hypothetical protein